MFTGAGLAVARISRTILRIAGPAVRHTGMDHAIPALAISACVLAACRSEPRPEVLQNTAPPPTRLELDPGFGRDGRVVFAPNDRNHQIYDLLPTGDLVLAAGVSTFPDAPSITLARFDDRGLLDPTFGTRGTLRIGTQRAEDAHLARDAKGRVLVAGVVMNLQRHDNEVLVARILRDGRLDGTFGVEGVMTFGLGASESATRVFSLPDGKILIVGLHATRGSWQTFVARLDQDGRLDATFGQGGSVLLKLAESTGVPRAVLDRDGSLVLGGDVLGSGPSAVFVARVRPTGALAPEFGEGGVKVIGSVRSAGALQLDGRGRILMSAEQDGDGVVIRLDSRGQRDPEFGRDGITERQLRQHHGYDVLVPWLEGSILALGSVGGGDEAHSIAVRFTASGKVDCEFAQGCALRGDIAGDIPIAGALDDRGRIVAAGVHRLPGDAYDIIRSQGLLLRLTPPRPSPGVRRAPQR